MNWADLCQTPDVNEGEEQEFLPLDESIFDSVHKLNENKASDEFMPKQDESGSSTDMKSTDSAFGQKTGSFLPEKDRSDIHKLGSDVLKGNEENSGQNWGFKRNSDDEVMRSKSEIGNRFSRETDGMNVDDSDVMKNFKELDICDYDEMEPELDVLKKSEKVIQERLRTAARLSTKNAKVEEDSKDILSREKRVCDKEESMSLAGGEDWEKDAMAMGNSVTKADQLHEMNLEANDRFESSLGVRSEGRSEGRSEVRSDVWLNDEKQRFLTTGNTDNCSISVESYRSSRGSDSSSSLPSDGGNKIERGLGSRKRQKRSDQTVYNEDLKTSFNEDRQKWLNLQLRGLSDPVLDNRNARYFVLEITQRDLVSAYKTNRVLSFSLDEIASALLKLPTNPVILLMVLKSGDGNARMCAIASAISSPYAFDIKTVKGDWKQIKLFDVKFLCKAKSRRIWEHTHGSQEELRRNIANRILGEYARSIRNGLVDKLMDDEVAGHYVSSFLSHFSFHCISNVLRVWPSSSAGFQGALHSIKYVK